MPKAALRVSLRRRPAGGMCWEGRRAGAWAGAAGRRTAGARGGRAALSRQLIHHPRRRWAPGRLAAAVRLGHLDGDALERAPLLVHAVRVGVRHEVALGLPMHLVAERGGDVLALGARVRSC